MYCTNCGHRLKDEEQFCTNCGSPRSNSPVAPERNRRVPAKILPAILVAVITICVFCKGITMEDMGETGLSVAMMLGCLPALALLIYIYRIDRIEREPIGLIIKLILCGALAAVPIVFAETALDAVLQSAIPDQTSLLYMIPENFIAVAMVEELGKFLVVRLLTWKHPAFDHRFDGVVYGATAALGFAALENVLYILSYGYAVGLIRAVTSIPGHCMYGVYIGYYYGQAKSADIEGDHKTARKLMRRGLLISILLHGVYDLACSMETLVSTLFLMVFIVVVNVVAFLNVRKYSINDRAV